MYHDPKLEPGGAYLFTWKPDRSKGCLKPSSNWSTGGTKTVQSGAPFFLLRQGSHHPSMIGWGRIRSHVYQTKHWDPARAKAGIPANMVDISFEFLTAHDSDEAIPRSVLVTHRSTKDGQWNTQSSGTLLKANVAEGVRQLFSERRVRIPRLDALGAVTFLEGGATQVLTTRHERSKDARQACIEHHGCVCHVCKFDFGRFYGFRARGFIEVHHLRPISQENKKEQIDPKRDLIPLCPNCHRVAHMRGTKEEPISIKQLRAMVKQHEQRA